MDQDLSLEPYPHHEQLHPLKEITFGAISGMVGKLIEFPMDTIKVRLQSSTPEKHTTTLQMIKQTYHNEGLLNGFYKGLKAPLVGACLENAILFSSYNTASTVLVNVLNDRLTKVVYTNDTLPFWTKLTAGGFAGFMASFVLTPVELIKCQLQVSNLTQSKVEHSYGSIMKSTLRNDGVIGLWKGLNSTILREVVGTAIWFGTYEYINEYFKHTRHDDPVVSNKNVQLLISGAMAGVTFNFSMFPVDTIKSNIQTNDLLNRGKAHSGFWSTTKTIIAKPGGITNLYNGLGITMIRCIPANALIFYTYEFLKRNF
ncbi:Mitochondrial ornithine transporter 1 [Candida viswanathii]|uniref:Mitochondrial thiamine pyrophosphate carrier 1 n=1 Tax=Candida viswanathii TaxID=5486 RepID=A0A367YEN0_9ASCO|nr:Mitochondrial ornithine transporter 1 [Candida viswanathii]